MIEIRCEKCASSHKMADLAKDWDESRKPLAGDSFFSLTSCTSCPNVKQNSLLRASLSWTDVVLIALVNLSLIKDSSKKYDGLSYYHVGTDIAPFIEANWHLFWSR